MPKQTKTVTIKFTDTDADNAVWREIEDLCASRGVRGKPDLLRALVREAHNRECKGENQ